MPRITNDEVLTKRHVRFFVQPGGPSPANVTHYSGADNTYMNIENATNPRSGGINPINVHDPRVVGRYRRIGRTVDAPDLPSWAVQFMQKKDSLPRHLTTLQNCDANYYEVVGDCKDLSDFASGWSSYVKIYSRGEVTDVTEDAGAFDSDEKLQDELSYTGANVYNIGKLGFGAKAAAEVFSEIVDIVYGSRVQCGTCGPDDDGTKLIYAVMNNTIASPGTLPSIVYSTDGGVTWTTTAINGSAAGDIPTAIDVVGQHVVIAFDDASTGGYFYSLLNSITGVPGTFTKVTTGFVASKAPNDIFVQSAREVWFVGNGGYIYKATNILSGVTAIDAGDTTTNDLNRIHGLDELLVAVGESGTIVFSENRGDTWTTPTSSPAINGMDALAVVGDFQWWIGGDNGEVFYTINKAETWVDAQMDSDSATVQDIVFPTDEVGYIAYATSDPTGKIRATWNGGETWTTTTPRLLNLPTYDRGNRIAVPYVPNFNIAANWLSVGGLAGNGSDGIILLANAAVI